MRFMLDDKKVLATATAKETKHHFNHSNTPSTKKGGIGRISANKRNSSIIFIGKEISHHTASSQNNKYMY